MGAVLHRVRQDEAGHPHRLDRHQGHGGVQAGAGDADYHRQPGILQGVAGSDEELVDGDKGKLWGVERQGQRGQIDFPSLPKAPR